MPSPILNDLGTSTRRSCVVLFADLVESVLLMQQFESEVIDAWRRFERQVRERMQASPGRLVRTAGDSVLLALDSSGDALRMAFALHRQCEALSQSLPEAARLWLRVGLHRCDVLDDAHEIYGAGVNLTARVAGLAGPGETWLTTACREDLIDGLDADIEDMGPRYLKHLPEPVSMYRARPAQKRPGDVRPQAQAPAFKPTLAIVPLAGDEPPMRVLGHALAEELLSRMGRHPQLRVLSLASTRCLQEQEPGSTAQQLIGAQFIVKGRCSRSGTQLRVELRLLRVGDGELLWETAWHCRESDLFAGHDAGTERAARELVAKLSQHEAQRICQLPMDSLPGYTLYLGAAALMDSLVPSEFERARQAFEMLAERYPRQAAPHSMLSRWHAYCLVQGWHADETATALRTRDHALRAIERDAHQAVALSTLALYRMRFEQRVDEAAALNQQSMDAAPQDPHPWAQQSSVLAHQGRVQEAVEHAHEALLRSPLDPNRFLFQAYAALAHLAAGEAGEAVDWARESLRLQLRHAPSHRLLVGALMLAGDESAARQAMQRFRLLFPQAADRPAPMSGQGPAWRDRLDRAVAAAQAFH